MAFKIALVLAFVGIVHSSHVAPLTLISTSQFPPLGAVHLQENPKPQYNINYGVHDSISGDSKTLTETREGDFVKGAYSVNDADGFKRTVTYTADGEKGFQAVVDRKPIEDVTADIQASIAAHIATPIAAPLVIKNVAPQHSAHLVYYNQGIINAEPLAYSAPLVINSAPIIHSGSGTLLTKSASPAIPITYGAYTIVNNSPVAAW